MPEFIHAIALGVGLRASFIRLILAIFIALIVARFSTQQVQAQSAEDIKALNSQVEWLYKQGKYAEAATRAEQALTLAERVLGREHSDTLLMVNNLGVMYQAQGRYDEAEALCKRALAARERILGEEDPRTLVSVRSLAVVYVQQGRYREAEQLFRRALEVSDRVFGPENPGTLTSVNNLAVLYQNQGRNSEAEPLFKRALQAKVQTLGNDHPSTLTGVNNLAELYRVQGRYNEAEPLYKRALDGRERTLGKEHPDTIGSVNNLAIFYDSQGRYGESEPLYRRAIEGYFRVLGEDHPDTLKCVNNLANLYRIQRRYGETEPLYRRALETSERVLGREHPVTLTLSNNLAELYWETDRLGEAEMLYNRALEIEANVFGPEHPTTLVSATSLATVYLFQGRFREAELVYKRTLDASERVLGKEHPQTLIRVANLADLYFAQSDWPRAAEFWRRSTTANAQRTQRGALDASVAGKKISEADQYGQQFWGLVKAVYRLAPAGGATDGGVTREMFQTAQWALSSEAAQSLAQMAARGSKGNVALAALVRERQDLANEWQRREQIQATALGQDAARRNANAEAENRERMVTIDRRIAAIDSGLKTEFSDYFALASPGPLSVEDVQAQLAVDEALVLFLDTSEWRQTPEETFIWVVTKTGMRWLRSDLGKAALAREVRALRCGLDYAAWEVPGCKDLTGVDYSKVDHEAGKPLPLDRQRAYALYKALFGEAEALIKDKKHLLLVPSGALTQLPFQVLVTAPPTGGAEKSVAWLIRDHAISVLPAVSSLKALRAIGHPSSAAKPLIGFGNPLLMGPDDRYTKRAELAREKQSCPKTSWERVASLVGWDRGILPIDTRSGLARPKDIRAQPPLPETADELCAVARDVGADISEIRLGAHATEHEVKSLSESGELAHYRIVHFATHGAMAGQLKQGFEPGLILTPPAEATGDDDGYLSASEIATLKLNADWVILSACNTAAGSAPNAEALSGIARAFIYAQARALLVSHWAVDSQATVKLITTAMREIARDKNVGRAEALRRAMLAMIDGSDPKQAQPAYWAPFVVIGEGAR